ncbi:MAG: catalase, partial [Solirubrobacterales bacterium]|nr:catalase [Solirubrobacterales bacterium]
PTLLEDFHFREKLTAFDHERIPERVVHARGAGAYGTFTCLKSLRELTRADFLSEEGLETPVFVRFSTVAGSRGSADTPRDVRGFATKFYTREGNYDLVGNNMPVFFIQDGIKFPDFVHAVKPEPRNEIPQAASAHDTLWDFVALQPETMHMMMWLMSDRALPASYRTMQGFGVHTFRLVNAEGKGTFVKFHWRPTLGTHSLVWDEAQKLMGTDPDFNRRDLWDSIEAGRYPEWDLALQLIPEEREHDFNFDLLDPTKLVPEEEVPLTVIGRMQLNRNPDNFFAETEQVAFHTANVVPGIDFSNDPLLQARNFSYLDTQLIRLGGPNFAQLPVNRPLAEPHHHQRDGYGQQRLHTSEVSYHPNTIGGGCPALASGDEDAYRHHAERVDGQKIRQRSESFRDFYGQARLFWNSMSSWEREHIVDAFSFELSKVSRVEIRKRVLENLGQVDTQLAGQVAVALGLPTPETTPANPHQFGSPALSISTQPSSVATQKLAVLAADGADTPAVLSVLKYLSQEGVVTEVVAPRGGKLKGGLAVDWPLTSVKSVQFDAVLVADGQQPAAELAANDHARQFVAEALRHAKPVGALGHGVEVLRSSLAPGVERADRGLSNHAGVVTLADLDPDGLDQFAREFSIAMAKRRHFDRDLKHTAA